MSKSRSVMGCEAIRLAFEWAHAQGRCALITFLTLGYPSADDTLALVPAMERGGADIIELGIPFSDPVADGPTIQGSSQQALEMGMTPKQGVGLVRQLRQGGVAVPLLLMGYYNPILSYGTAAFVRDCAAVGVDGLIIPDLPPEEAAPLAKECRHAGLALVFLVAPTSDEQRVAEIARQTSGFLYVVSQLGTTGQDLRMDKALARRLALAKSHAATPVAVGFGIERPAQVAELAADVDGVIVGSAIVRKSKEGPEALLDYVASLHSATNRSSLAGR